jgi:Transglutaminase-like superfamily
MKKLMNAPAITRWAEPDSADVLRGQMHRRQCCALLLCCAILASTAAILLLWKRAASREARRPHPSSLAELLSLAPARIAEVPLVELNLLCARGLCSSNEPDPPACAATLEAWAAHVRSETERHEYRFERNPAEFENSAGFFRMLMLCVVLAEDYGIHYDAQRQTGPAVSRTDDGFFADPSSVFLHGLLGPERKGTCSSLPVLYVAVGRQVGYPLKLVTTRGHLFVRWEGEGERFNVEATARGLSLFDDDYYRHWPFEISSAEEAAEGYLKSLTGPEELAVFLSVRGMCLREQGRLSEAVESFAAAAQMAPGCHSYRQMLRSLQTGLGPQTRRAALTPQAMGQGARY